MAAGLLIPLWLVAVPALVRATRISKRAASAGRPMTPGAKFTAFVTSIFLVILVLVSGVVALCIACFAVVFSMQPAAAGPPGPEETQILVFLVVAMFICTGAWIAIAIWRKGK